jgi:DNA-directed RNA polymerase subunit RPC12/RpoP
MSSLSSGTGRLDPPKIEFECTCGKKYRVKATKAGKTVRCKRCRIKLTVPGSMKISMRTRQAVLEELGIDPEQSAKAYEQEKEQGYRCSACDKKLVQDELRDAYGSEGLTCSDCRAADVDTRDAEYKKEEKKKEPKHLEEWTVNATTPEAARRKALGFGALFLIGTTGLLNTVGVLFGSPGFGAALAIGLVVAGIGARSIYKAELS